MEFSLLDLKNFETLFPNKNITDVAYKKVVNDYINDKLSYVKNINSLSGNELIKKKKDYLNTYILPLMNLLFSKYYIQYNNLNILVNKNNSILHEFNNLKLFYAYNNPIINSVNVYFYKKYSGLNNNDATKTNNTLINLDKIITLMKVNKEKIVPEMKNYIKTLNYEYKKLNYYITLDGEIDKLAKKTNDIIENIINNSQYNKLLQSNKFDKIIMTTPSPVKIDMTIEQINKSIENILYKVINYHIVSNDRISLKSNIEEILKNLVLILIKKNIIEDKNLNDATKKIERLESDIASFNKINKNYEEQIKLYEATNLKNDMNNNIKKIKEENLFTLSEKYYKSIFEEVKKINLDGTNTLYINNKTNKPINDELKIEKNFINTVLLFIFYDNCLTNDFISIFNKKKTPNNANRTSMKQKAYNIETIIYNMKKYKEKIKIYSINNKLKDEIIKEDRLKTFLSSEESIFDRILTSLKNTTNVPSTTPQANLEKIQKIISKCNKKIKTLDEINANIKKIIEIGNEESTLAASTIPPSTYTFKTSNKEAIENLIKVINVIYADVNANIAKKVSSKDLINVNDIIVYSRTGTGTQMKLNWDTKLNDASYTITNMIKIEDNTIKDQEASIKQKQEDLSKFLIKKFIETIKQQLKIDLISYKKNNKLYDTVKSLNKNNVDSFKNNLISLFDNFLNIDKELIIQINNFKKNQQKNRLLFYLEQQDTQFQKIKQKIEPTMDINSLNNLIPSYITSFKNKNKNTKQNLFINQIKKDNKSIGNNPEIQQFLNTIYTYNDTLIANLASKINTTLIENELIKKQINNLTTKITNLYTKINKTPAKKNINNNINNKINNKNLIYIPAYTDIIQLYFMILIFIKLLYTNS